MQLPKLYKKKECYRLSWFSRLLLLGILVLLFFGIRASLYGFLSPVKPVQSNILVVEGWIDDFAIEDAYKIYKEGNYNFVISVGGPMEMGNISHPVSTADIGMRSLLYLGVDSSKIVSVSRENVLRDRTYHSALAVKEWLEKNHPEIKNFNMVSLGPHSRRSWYLFRQAMPDKEIGIIAIRDKRYDPETWWKTSKGMRSVVTEAFGYFYVFIVT